MSEDFRQDDGAVGPPDSDSPEAKRKYGQQLAIDALLRTSYAENRKAISPFSNPGKYSRRSGLLVAAASVALVGIFWWASLSRSDLRFARVEVVSLEGEASVSSSMDISDAEPIGVGAGVEIGEVVRTGGGSSLQLRYADDTRIYLQEYSELAIAIGSKAEKLLMLKSGRVSFDVEPQPIGRPLRIETPYAEASVLGTRFSLDVKNDYTEIAVDEGKVGFIRPTDTRSFLVQPGQIAILGPAVEGVEANDPSTPEIHGFTLVSVLTGEPVVGFDPIPEGAVISTAELPKGGVNIRVNAVGRMRFVEIDYTGAPKPKRERFYPYSVGGDDLHFGGDYRSLPIAPGTMMIKATPVMSETIFGSPAYLSVTFQ